MTTAPATTFAYRALDPMGNVRSGEIDAPSPDEAVHQLCRDGLNVQRIEAVDETEGLALFAPRIRKNDIIYVTAQLAVMVDTGVSLAAAIDGIARQEQNRALAKVLGDLRRAVESGEDFSQALARFPRLFDTTYVALVRASESMGTLGAMLDRIASYMRKEVDARAKVRAAMVYPCVMMLLSIGVSVFLLTGVLPKFEPLFSRKGVELPMPTLVMLTISNAFMDYWFVWLATAIGMLIGVVLLLRHPRGRVLWDWIKISVPLIGPMTRKVVISRSVRTLGTMLTSGVPMLEAIRLCAEISGNYHYRRLWQKVELDVTSGHQICASLAGHPLFPSTLTQMIAAGEETGKLGPVFDRISNYYDTEVETGLKAVVSIIEPALICVMGFIVGGIGLALLLPIFTLSQHAG